MGGMPPGQGGMPADMKNALSKMGLTDDQITSVQDDIQTALDKLKTSSTNSTNSTDSTDAKDAFQSTIDQVLKAHGVDTEKLQSMMGPPAEAADRTSSTSGTVSGKDLLAQLGYPSGTDDSSDQLLLSLLPLMDEKA